MVVRFDEERMILQYVQEQLLLGINDDADALAVETGHDFLIDIIRQRFRNGAGQYERVALLQFVELGEQFFAFCFADIRSLTVDFRLAVSFCLDIDTRETFLELDKVARYAEALELVFDFLTRETGINSRYEFVRDNSTFNLRFEIVNLFIILFKFQYNMSVLSTSS